MILLVLLVGAMGFVLWYVIDRRAKMRASPLPVVAPQTAGQTPGTPVDLTKTDGQTIDFSSGQPVVKNSPEDKAAMDAALKDMEEAKKNVTFEAPKKPAGTQTTPPKP